MESFLVAAKVVLPMAVMMGLGVLLRLWKVTDRATMKKVDGLTFRVFTPCLAFFNIYNTDFSQLDGSGYLIYGTVGLVICFLAALLAVPKCIREKPTAATFGQMLVRPNYVIFGAAVAQGIYGEGNIGLVMLMGAIAIPLFNIMSAIILELGRGGHPSPKKFLLAVLKNPIFVATALGLVVSLSGLHLPALAVDVIQDLGAIATPMSFLSIGVGLTFGAYPKKKLLAVGVLVRLVLSPLIFVTGAILLGFQGPEMCAILLLFATPVAVASYPAAVAMDADGDLAGQLVAYCSIFCLVTIFAWTLLLNSMQLL